MDVKYPTNILYVSNGLETADALHRALSLAQATQARLNVLVVCPQLPETMQDYESVYEDGIKQRILDNIADFAASRGLDPASLDSEISLEFGHPPARHVVMSSLMQSHDLVFKAADPTPDGKGYRAADLALVRKCLRPVWLHRAAKLPDDSLRVAVAIDPDSIERTGHDLSIQLLRVTRRIADNYSGKLYIISCWDYPFEDYLSRKAWFQDSSELSEIVESSNLKHRAALSALITESGITGPTRILHLRGQPSQVIPAVVDQNRIDLLAMGSLARTGIAGFFIGNTSEDVMRELRCSVAILKPSEPCSTT